MRGSAMRFLFAVLGGAILFTLSTSFVFQEEDAVRIVRTEDFAVTGDGSSANWKKAEWHTIPSYTALPAEFATKFKVMYSREGMYFLYLCGDKKITSTMRADFLDLWNEDVIEVFIQPDARRPAYLEYELSPMDYELPILIYNDSSRLNSWLPFHYNPDQKTRHATSVQGGEKKGGAAITSWMGEFFIPYKIMKLITSEIPVRGTKWKGNLFRIDYDNGSETLFSWRRTSGSFHEYKKFGNFLFE